MTMAAGVRLAASHRTGMLAGLTAVWLLFAGCAGGGPEPISTGARLHGTEDLNPNQQGRASPVMVRIFPLSTDAAFRSAGIVNLQGDEPALVAGDLTGPVLSQLLRPGQTVALDLSYAPATAYLGVIAEFIDPNAEWRAVVKVPEQGMLRSIRRPDLSVTVSAAAVSASFE